MARWPSSGARRRSSNTCVTRPMSFDDGDGLAVAHRDAGRLLAAVLERVEPEVGEVGDRPGRARRRRTRRRRGRSRRRSPLQYPMHRRATPTGGSRRAGPSSDSAADRRTVRTAGRRAEGVGMASRQAWVASASGDVEGAVGDEPVAAGGAESLGRARRRRAAALDAASSASGRGRRRRTTRDADSENQASAGTSSVPSATVERRTPPAIAISASATASPPSEQSCTPPTDARRRPARATKLVQRAPRRRGRPRAACPPRSPCTRRPLRAAELGRGRDRAARCASPSRSAGRRRRRRRARRSARRRRRPAWGRCRARATRCRSSRCRRRRGCRARGTPRSCRRRPRRTATSPRGAPGCRS